MTPIELGYALSYVHRRVPCNRIPSRACTWVRRNLMLIFTSTTSVDFILGVRTKNAEKRCETEPKEKCLELLLVKSLRAGVAVGNDTEIAASARMLETAACGCLKYAVQISLIFETLSSKHASGCNAWFLVRHAPFACRLVNPRILKGSK